VQIAQEAAISGFFAAATELLIERAEACLTATEQGDSGASAFVEQPVACTGSPAR
jgi:hypothetical protein